MFDVAAGTRARLMVSAAKTAMAIRVPLRALILRAMRRRARRQGGTAAHGVSSGPLGIGGHIYLEAIMNR